MYHGWKCDLGYEREVILQYRQASLFISEKELTIRERVEWFSFGGLVEKPLSSF